MLTEWENFDIIPVIRRIGLHTYEFNDRGFRVQGKLESPTQVVKALKMAGHGVQHQKSGTKWHYFDYLGRV